MFSGLSTRCHISVTVTNFNFSIQDYNKRSVFFCYKGISRRVIAIFSLLLPLFWISLQRCLSSSVKRVLSLLVRPFFCKFVGFSVFFQFQNAPKAKENSLSWSNTLSLTRQSVREYRYVAFLIVQCIFKL